VRTEADWLRCLESVRKVGYAVSHSESFDGASSVAVPVISRRVAIASVSVFGPTEVIEPQVDRLVPVLVAASRRIARSHAG
jgi:DNA-binding IclR family transcriptional regulator